jgi:hypothetical protein
MRTLLRTAFIITTLGLLAAQAPAQWSCLYATYDDDANGNATGHNTASVGVISENTFVALVMNPNTRNFMVPYVNADSAIGRLYGYGYGGGTLNFFQIWSDYGFDAVVMNNATKIVTTPDGVIYVANNDIYHNILVFKLANDTVDTFSPYYRQETGDNSIFGLAVDQNGYVYVSNDTTTGKTDDIKIYPPIASWAPPYTASPLRTIDLPDGVYRGLEVSPDGSQLFVSDNDNRKIWKYTGSPTTGYTADPSFSFALTAADTAPNTTLLPVPIHMAYLSPNNILFVAVDVHGYGSAYYTYEYGKILLLNPFTGEPAALDPSISVIDVAQWNFDHQGGSYTNRVGGTVPGNASGYTSTFDVDFDQNGNLYSQSFYGWTIEKWKYSGTLPVITGVETVSSEVPESFALAQNYPNPFNPSTTIEFTVHKAGNVRLAVYDLLGRQVEMLLDKRLDAGVFRVNFDARLLPGGTYFYTLENGEQSLTKKMMLVK